MASKKYCFFAIIVAVEFCVIEDIQRHFERQNVLNSSFEDNTEDTSFEAGSGFEDAELESQSSEGCLKHDTSEANLADCSLDSDDEFRLEESNVYAQ